MFSDNKKAALIVATLSSFLAPFVNSSINIALPSIGEEFLIDAVLLSWVATSFNLTSAVFIVPLGKVADIFGRKKIFTYGILIFIFSSFLCLVASSITLLILFRVFQGIGSAMIFGTSIAILTSVFPPGERGKALGINVTAVYLGLSLGPVLGGVLTQHLGWRSIFLFNIPFGLLAFFLVFWKLKGEWIDARGEKFDFTGSLIYSISLALTMYGFSLMPVASGIWITSSGLSGLLLFVWWEMRIENPVLDINLFMKNKVFAFSNLAALISFSSSYAAVFLLSLYLQYIKGLEPQIAGLVLMSQPVTMVIFSPLAGRLSDKIEPRILASSGMAIKTVGLVLLIFLNTQTSLTFIVLILIVFGFGFAIFASPNTNAIMSSVEKNFYGIASATVATMRKTGQLLSMGIVMLIFSINMGKIQITPEYHELFISSIRLIFIISALLCFSGIFASLASDKANNIDDSLLTSSRDS